VGITSDGTVIAVGNDDHKRCDVDSWIDIIQVAASSGHTVGLKDDGTAVAVGYSPYGQCSVGWMLIS
jgi:alpha-tubulin suppressor-like RCC1 family protein